MENEIPHNLEAEEAVLGSILIDPDAVIGMRDILAGSDFYRRTNGQIYEAACDLFQESSPIDIVTMSDLLQRREQLENIGGDSYLISLSAAVPTPIHGRAYAKVVKDASLRRQLIQKAGEIAGLAYDETKEIGPALGRAMRMIADLDGRGGDIIPVTAAVDRWADETEKWLEAGKGIRGIATGLSDMDRLTGGLMPKNLTLIAGRTSMGKTSLALQIAGSVAKLGHPVLYFSLESGAETLIGRLACNWARVDGAGLLSGQISQDDLSKVYHEVAKIRELPMQFHDLGGVTSQEAAAMATRKILQDGIELVVFDHIQRAANKGENANQRWGEVSWDLKTLAQREGVSVVALSQLSRLTERQEEHRPELHHLRESGALEQDADVVLMLYWPDYYVGRKGKGQMTKTLEVHVAKNRNGPAARKVEFYFDSKSGFIGDLAGDTEEEKLAELRRYGDAEKHDWTYE